MNDRTNGAERANNGNPEQVEQAEEAAQTGSSSAKLGGSRAQERIAALDTSGASLTEELEQLAGELQIAWNQIASIKASQPKGQPA